MENETDQLEVENPEVAQDTNLDTSEEVDTGALDKAKEIAKNQRIRAEKAEKALKALKGGEKEVEKQTPENKDLSTEDLYALMESKVPKEDIGEVKKAAKLLGVSIIDALNDPMVKSRLSQKAEERNTAQATNTGSTKKAVRGTTDEKLLSDFEKGTVDEGDIEQLVAAQFKQRKAQAQRD